MKEDNARINNISDQNITAVIVTYNPEITQLQQLYSSLSGQVSHIVIVDNGSEINMKTIALDSTILTPEIILNNVNLGIAYAHNRGIEWARENGADYVLLMDQDSIPASDMVEKLLTVQEKHGSNVVVGPNYKDDKQNNPPPFIRIEGLSLKRCKQEKDRVEIEVDYLISSGSLIPMQVFDKVGMMKEELFIDYVDIEWGLRAKYNNIQSYGVFNATMAHSLGEDPIEFMGRKIPLHSALRHYYLCRNAVALYKEKWIPLNWKIVDGWRLLLRYVFYTVFTKSKIRHFKMMTKGLKHGLLGKMGKLNESRN